MKFKKELFGFLAFTSTCYKQCGAASDTYSLVYTTRRSGFNPDRRVV